MVTDDPLGGRRSTLLADLIDLKDLDVLEKLVGSEDDVVYVSGSRVEGFGNPNSDVDFFIVSDREEPPAVDQPVLQAGYYVDAEYWKWDVLESMASRFANFDVCSTEVAPFNFSELDLYYRTAIGIPVVNEARFSLLQGRFSKSTFSGVYAAICKSRSEDLLCIALGSLATKDELCALPAARQAAVAASEAFLAEQGEAYPNPKWRFEKALRLFGKKSAEYREIWEIQNSGGRSTEDYVTAVRRFCSRCGVEAQPKGGSWVKVTWAAVRQVPLREQLLLVAQGQVYRLDGWRQRVWRELNGLDQTEVVECITRELGITSEDAKYVARSFIGDLARRGLVDLEES